MNMLKIPPENYTQYICMLKMCGATIAPTKKIRGDLEIKFMRDFSFI